MKTSQDSRRRFLICLAVTLAVLFIAWANPALSQAGSSKSGAHFSTDAYMRIASGMTRAEVRSGLGVPAAVRSDILPQGPFMGPQVGIDRNSLDSQRRYEEWHYENKDTVCLIWFGDPKRQKSDWRVIGKTCYPKGAVF